MIHERERSKIGALLPNNVESCLLQRNSQIYHDYKKANFTSRYLNSWSNIGKLYLFLRRD